MKKEQTKTISYDTVHRQYETWCSSFEPNNLRGINSINFCNGEQWKTAVVNQRLADNKESLTFNVTIKHSRRMKSQSKQIEFSLNLSPINEDYAKENIEETNAFRMLLGSTMLNDDVLKTLSDTLDKALDYGYAFVEIGFKRADVKTLCLVPDIRFHEDPSIAFWDKNAKLSTKVDGRFCGMRRVISRDEFLNKYPEYRDKNPGWLLDQNNELIDYWYREYEQKNYVSLQGGGYKREDLLTDDDRLKIMKYSNGKPIMKSRYVDCIYQARFCNEFMLGDPIKYPTDDLPLMFHPALRAWTPEQEKTYPFVYHLEGAQHLHNYVNSQLATAAKNFTGDKWLMSHSNVQTPDSIKNAINLNTRAGAFAFDNDIGTIRREQPAEIPMSMIQLSQTVKQEVDDIAGALMDNQQSDQADISGVALDKITHNINLLQAAIIAAHIEFVNQAGKLIRQIIPRIYTEERTVIVKKQDGSAAAVTINQLLPTGKIKNNIKDIDDNFHYEIKAGPSTVMLKENTRKALQEIYSIDPTAFRVSADLYVRSLETPYSAELERRFSATYVDPQLIKYSQGEITFQQFQEYMKQQKQEAAQNAQNDPAVAAQAGIAQAENMKAQVMARDSETKRLDVVSKIKINEMNLRLNMEKLMNQTQNDQVKNQLETMQKELDINRQLMETLTNANASQQ